MKWRKVGKVFDPTRHMLPNACEQFAQSPQVLAMGDFVRVYFSTRAKDATGKYLSHIAFVDMAKNLQDVLRVSDRTVIPLGALGAFDEHGIFPMSVVRHGAMVYGFTGGWSRRLSVSVETAIGLAVSTDGGATFARIGDGPVLSSTLHEPFLVGDPFVKVLGGRFHMWYIFGTSWKRYSDDAEPDRTYKIGHAVSPNGVDWEKEENRRIVADRLGPDESQALPTVVQIGVRYHMFFCYRHSFDFRANRERGYRIGHAWSEDLITWTRDDDDLCVAGTPGEWDGDMQCYPHAFEWDGHIGLFYNGNEFGRYGFGLALLEQ